MMCVCVCVWWGGGGGGGSILLLFFFFFLFFHSSRKMLVLPSIPLGLDKSRYLSVAGGGSRRTRSHPFQYHCPNAYTDGLKSSFFPRTWNGLTTEAVSAETVDGFKAKI